MSDNISGHLKQLLVSRYAYWIKKLERLAGSKDRAADVLHETWLRLESVSASSPIANVDAYIMRIASNIVIDQHRRGQHYVEQEDIDAVLDVPDEMADPERIVAARLRFAALTEVLLRLTPRRRAILLAARVEGQLNRDIAESMGISLRLVERELGIAIQYCLDCMNEVSESGKGGRTGRRKF
jgi:RNA polymerase sigma factor (sigma-70 family)